MSLLQSYDIKPSTYTREAFVHYKGKADAHGFTLDVSRLLTLNYIRPSNLLPESDIEQVINAVFAVERKFVGMGQITGLPVSISVDKAPRSPINWTATYLYPVGEVEDYMSTIFESETAPFEKDTTGILSWSFRMELGYEPYIRPVGNRQVIEGYVYGDISVSIDVTTDFEITDPTTVNSVITQGLQFNINVNTLRVTGSKNEDTSLKTLYRYGWQFGVL